MLSREEVINSFRYILGRLPENEGIIERHRNFQTIEELRNVCLKMPEISEKLQSNVAGRHLHSPAIRVDVDGDPAAINSIIESTGRAWTTLGETDPHYSVLTVEAFKSSNIGTTEEIFYQSGQDEVAKIASCFSRNHEDLESVTTAIDFGCGLGRISLKMADRRIKVTGVDISANHLKIASERAKKVLCTNVDFVHAANLGNLAQLPSADLVYTLIVLQHNTPPVIKRILEILSLKVNKNGFIYFQVPTYLTGYEFNLEKYQPHDDRIFEMHVIEQRDVFSILSAAGFSVIESMEDGCTTDQNFISTTFFAKRDRV